VVLVYINDIENRRGNKEWTRITLSTQDTGRRQTNQKPQHDEKHEPHQNKTGEDQGVILYCLITLNIIVYSVYRAHY
jgi:hypothetical protein